MVDGGALREPTVGARSASPVELVDGAGSPPVGSGNPVTGLVENGGGLNVPVTDIASELTGVPAGADGALRLIVEVPFTPLKVSFLTPFLVPHAVTKVAAS
jgi:hypothetical protein